MCTNQFCWHSSLRASNLKSKGKMWTNDYKKWINWWRPECPETGTGFFSECLLPHGLTGCKCPFCPFTLGGGFLTKINRCSWSKTSCIGTLLNLCSQRLIIRSVHHAMFILHPLVLCIHTEGIWDPSIHPPIHQSGAILAIPFSEIHGDFSAW